MICPHCGIGTSPNFHEATVGSAHQAHFDVLAGNCSECGELIARGRWASGTPSILTGRQGLEWGEDLPLYPHDAITRPIPPEVTGEHAQIFREACAVLPLSPRASAALSRHLLQHIIHEKAEIRGRNLNDEIDQVIAQRDVSSNLAEDLDMIRQLGNFAAHPIKSTNTGEVVDVEPGEAEALLDVLEQLFDHYFVRPAKRGALQAQVNAKLAEAGKPALKGRPTAREDLCRGPTPVLRRLLHFLQGHRRSCRRRHSIDEGSESLLLPLVATHRLPVDPQRKSRIGVAHLVHHDPRVLSEGVEQARECTAE